MGIRDLLNRPAFRRLLVAQSVASFGDWLGTFALVALVLERTGSATAAGGVLVLRLLPSALAAPLVARVVTRWRHRGVMMTANLVRAGLAAALPFLPSLWWLCGWAVALGVVGLMFLPARDAAVPVLLRHRGEEPGGRTLQLANGVTMALSCAMIPIGAGAFGALVFLSDLLAWTGRDHLVAVSALDAAAYLISLVAVRGLPRLGPRRGARGAGLLAALRFPAVGAVLPAVAAVSLGLGSLFAVGAPFVRDVLRAGFAGFGALVALLGVGAFAGVLGARLCRGAGLIGQIRLGAAAQGLVIIAMGALASTAWWFPGTVLLAAAATATLIGGITYLQETLAGPGRALGLTALHAVLRSGWAVAAAAASAAADALGRTSLVPVDVAPAGLVLIVAGLAVFCGTFLVRRPDGEDRAVTDLG